MGTILMMRILKSGGLWTNMTMHMDTTLTGLLGIIKEMTTLAIIRMDTILSIGLIMKQLKSTLRKTQKATQNTFMIAGMNICMKAMETSLTNHLLIILTISIRISMTNGMSGT